MEIKDIQEPLDVCQADLTGSRFTDVNLRQATFDDVNLQGATFTNVNLRSLRFVGANLKQLELDDVNLEGSTFTNVNLGGTRFDDVNLTGVSIEDATVVGATIDGVLLTDLLRAYRRRMQVVLYAKNLKIVQAFYQTVFELSVEHSEPNHVVLGSAVSQLVIIQVPASIAATIDIADPPARRTQTPVKMVFEVTSLAAARDAARKFGGGLDPAEREWAFQGYQACDGHDPEGNVVQFRQRANPPCSP